MKLIPTTADIPREDLIKDMREAIAKENLEKVEGDRKLKKKKKPDKLEKEISEKDYEEIRKEAESAGNNIQEYIKKLLNYIPKEIIFAYIALTTILSPLEEKVSRYDILLWIVIGVLFFTTILWIYRGVSDKGFNFKKAGSNTHFRAIASAFAFIAWVAVLGEPFTSIAGYHIEYGRAAVLLLTILIPGFGWKLKKE